MTSSMLVTSYIRHHRHDRVSTSALGWLTSASRLDGRHGYLSRVRWAVSYMPSRSPENRERPMENDSGSSQRSVNSVSSLRAASGSPAGQRRVARRSESGHGGQRQVAEKSGISQFTCQSQSSTVGRCDQDRGREARGPGSDARSYSRTRKISSRKQKAEIESVRIVHKRWMLSLLLATK